MMEIALQRVDIQVVVLMATWLILLALFGFALWSFIHCLFFSD